MHTGDVLTGRICKCMDCARARNERLEREVRRRFRNEWNELDATIMDAAEAIRQAEQRQGAARARMGELKSRIVDEILAEAER